MAGGIIVVVKMIVLGKLQNLKGNISVVSAVRTIPCRKKGPSNIFIFPTDTY